jgi:hypothetical protein
MMVVLVAQVAEVEKQDMLLLVLLEQEVLQIKEIQVVLLDMAMLAEQARIILMVVAVVVLAQQEETL